MRYCLFVLLTLGCAAATVDPPSCIDDGDCGSYVCEVGECLPPVETRVDCETAADCPDEFTCEDRGTVRICIAPDIFAPMECGDCAFPSECREGVCVAPDGTGASCEFDPECGVDHLCIAGRCTWDPRVPRTCLDGEMCPDGLVCTSDGRCVCRATADCPVGTVCDAEGGCIPEEGGCVADDECPSSSFCDRGMCIPVSACDVVHPDLSTDPVWEVSSVYNFREALPGWLDSFLNIVSGPFRFLSGGSDYLDLGLPSILADAIGGIIGDAISTWVDENLPPYTVTAMGAIADLNDILSTWEVKEIMHLTSRAGRDHYGGDSEWVEVAFDYRGERLVGTPGSVIGWSYEPEDYNAQAACGTFNIESHDVEIGIGAIIAWAIDAVIFEASDHAYQGLEDMATSLRATLCSFMRGFAETHVDGSGEMAREWCDLAMNALIDLMLDEVNSALLRLDLVRLKGHATIASGNRLEPGVWEGSLVGGNFSGSWSASR